MILRPKNWTQFQHYKSRRPPWIRLYRSLLDDFEFQRLPVASKALAPLLWLLASESMTGDIDADVPRLAFRLRMTEQDVSAGLTPLIDSQFFESVHVASSVKAPSLQRATPESETEKRQSRGERDAHAREGVPHGTQDAGTALTRTPSAEDALAEVLNAWRDVEAVCVIAMEAWLAHWSRVHAGREMPGHQRIAAAKLLAGLGDSATQRRAVQLAEANGWKALRHGDGKAPPKSKADLAAEARKDSERVEWQNLRDRAERVGFRMPTHVDDLAGYRTLVERAEAHRPRAGAVQPIAKLLGSQPS